MPVGRVLLIIGGGIAAYKCLDLIRRGRERGLSFRCVMTGAAAQFVTPLAVAGLAGEKVYQDLFSLTDEAEMGHIRLSREADLVVVAPATADLMAKMAAGLADDLASTLLLASDKPILIAPAMNPQMWGHPATRRNLTRLAGDGVLQVGPNPGDMACGEVGAGRMAEPHEILDAIERALAPRPQPLRGRRAVVTSGPTREPLDPVRYLSNHSSGRQGHAIARALVEAGAEVTLVSGPVGEPDPPGARVIRIESAREMLAAVEAALPADIAVFAAAVADWRPAALPAEKIKKRAGEAPPAIALVENPDILGSVARGPRRPGTVNPGQDGIEAIGAKHPDGFGADLVGHPRRRREDDDPPARQTVHLAVDGGVVILQPAADDGQCRASHPTVGRGLPTSAWESAGFPSHVSLSFAGTIRTPRSSDVRTKPSGTSKADAAKRFATGSGPGTVNFGVK